MSIIKISTLETKKDSATLKKYKISIKEGKNYFFLRQGLSTWPLAILEFRV